MIYRKLDDVYLLAEQFSLCHYQSPGRSKISLRTVHLGQPPKQGSEKRRALLHFTIFGKLPCPHPRGLQIAAIGLLLEFTSLTTRRGGKQCSTHRLRSLYQ